MIYQISSLKPKTEPAPNITDGLIRARQIQARLKEQEQFADELLPRDRGPSQRSDRFR